MMTLTRRSFLKGSTTGLAGAVVLPGLMTSLLAAAPSKIRIAARHFGGDCQRAKQAGMDGVEVGVGGRADTLEIANPAVRQKYKDSAQAAGLAVSSLSMDLLNTYPLFEDPQAPAWVGQCIDAAKDLGAKAMLVPFFGKANLVQGKEFKKDAVDALVGRLKELAPKAKAAGVTLGIECTLSAKKYLELLDRVGSEAVGAYYDIGNCTNAGLDVPADIKELKGRMCMIHFKDGGSYLGEGKVKMEPVAEALHAINYQGWIVLETSNPSKDAIADCKRNGDFARKLMGL